MFVVRQQIISWYWVSSWSFLGMLIVRLSEFGPLYVCGSVFTINDHSHT